jgi:hypothetical protein
MVGPPRLLPKTWLIGVAALHRPGSVETAPDVWAQYVPQPSTEVLFHWNW